MKFYTREQFLEKYQEYASYNISERYIVASCEMIFSQVGLMYRSSSWNIDTVPEPIKLASMEQLAFMLDHDIPFVDFNKSIRAGNMVASIKSDYSTLALRILANNGYLYRGNPISANMGMNIPFGE